MNPSVFFLAITLWATAFVAAQEYKIQVQHPAKQGQQIAISCRLEETRRNSATFSGRSSPEEKTNFVAELEGVIKVLEADPKGRMTRATCTISNCVRVDGPQRRELQPGHTVVVATLGADRPQLVVNGKPLDGESQKIVSAAMQLAAGDPPAEKILSTERPRRIGESWDIDPEFLASVFQLQQLGINTEDVEGRTTLEQVVKVNGIDCLELASKIYLKKFAPPLPPGVRLKQTFGALRLSGKFPLDAAMAPLEEATDFDISFIGQATEGPNAGVTMKMTATTKTLLRRHYLK